MRAAQRPIGLVTVALALAATAATTGGCAKAGSGTRTSSDALTIYASLPLRGERAATSTAIVHGMKLAIAQAHGKVGDYRLRLAVLDDTDGEPPRWSPAQAGANARRAAQDRDAIAYVGDVDSGATAIAIPITNEAGILQVTPASTYTGLTEPSGADKGEPQRYYPSGMRTFGRIVPGDQVQAPAMTQLLRARGVKSIFLVDDADSYGERLAAAIARRARTLGIEVRGDDRVKPDPGSAAKTARKVALSGADAIVYTGAPASATLLWRAAHEEDPAIGLFGGASLADSAFAASVGPAAQDTYLTSPSLEIDKYAPAARNFAAAYRRAFDHGPPAYAIQGYEAVQAILAAIRAAGDGGNDRRQVIRQFFRIDGRRSVLGTYSIDGNGDTTLSDYGSYRVSGGRLRFFRVLNPVENP